MPAGLISLVFGLIGLLIGMYFVIRKIVRNSRNQGAVIVGNPRPTGIKFKRFSSSSSSSYSISFAFLLIIYFDGAFIYSILFCELLVISFYK